MGTKAETLVAALCRAQLKIAGIEKNAKNEYHRYKYTSAEAMIAHCRDALASEGLAILPVGQRIRSEPIAYVEESKGVSKNKSVPAVLVCSYLLSGHDQSVALETEIPIVPEAGRPLDKARFAAATEALGYLLRDVLLIPRGEGISEREDADATEPQPETKRKQEPPADRMAALDAALVATGIPLAAVEAFVLEKMGKTIADLSPQQLSAVANRMGDKSVQEQIWAAYAGPGSGE